MTSIVNAMSVDVEDYFQVSAFEGTINRNMWDKIPCRIERNSERILSMFSDANVKATFFVLGWIAERYPGLVRTIVNEGHEVASHGYCHIRVTSQNIDEFRDDVLRTRYILENISGTRVKGYRAASYSICKDNMWAIEVLKECGHEYSSSIYPVKHDLYGIPDSPRHPYMHEHCDLLEIPISTIRINKHNIPCGGGGYFRLYPYMFSRWAINKINRAESKPCIFYFHPWEIDPDQPRQTGLNFKTRFRHYFNLNVMEKRLFSLLREFSWDRIDNVYIK